MIKNNYLIHSNYDNHDSSVHGRHLNGHGSPTTNSSHRDSHGNYSVSSPNNHHNFSNDGYQYGRFDASALHIAHALKQTEIQKGYAKPREKPIDFYLVSPFKIIIIKFQTLLIFYFNNDSANRRAKALNKPRQNTLFFSFMLSWLNLVMVYQYPGLDISWFNQNNTKSNSVY